jgi:hypothetical protein
VKQIGCLALELQTILKLNIGLLLHLLCALQSLNQLSLLSLELSNHPLSLHCSSILLLLLSQIDLSRLLLFAQSLCFTFLQRLLSSEPSRKGDEEREKSGDREAYCCRTWCARRRFSSSSRSLICVFMFTLIFPSFIVSIALQERERRGG